MDKIHVHALYCAEYIQAYIQTYTRTRPTSSKSQDINVESGIFDSDGWIIVKHNEKLYQTVFDAIACGETKYIVEDIIRLCIDIVWVCSLCSVLRSVDV